MVMAVSLGVCKHMRKAVLQQQDTALAEESVRISVKKIGLWQSSNKQDWAYLFHLVNKLCYYDTSPCQDGESHTEQGCL